MLQRLHLDIAKLDLVAVLVPRGIAMAFSVQTMEMAWVWGQNMGDAASMAAQWPDDAAPTSQDLLPGTGCESVLGME